jgi:hypothetical protein
LGNGCSRSVICCLLTRTSPPCGRRPRRRRPARAHRDDPLCYPAATETRWRMRPPAARRLLARTLDAAEDVAGSFRGERVRMDIRAVGRIDLSDNGRCSVPTARPDGQDTPLRKGLSVRSVSVRLADARLLAVRTSTQRFRRPGQVSKNLSCPGLSGLSGQRRRCDGIGISCPDNFSVLNCPPCPEGRWSATRTGL